MTVIAGIEHQGRVYLAGDSCSSTTYTYERIRCPKVFRNGPFVFGACGSKRYGQVLRIPGAFDGAPSSDVFAWLADRIRKLCSDGGLNVDRNADKSDIGDVIVGHRHMLAKVESDFSVLTSRRGYLATGSGAETANGAMWAATRVPNWSPRAVLRAAVRAAAAHCPSVRGPFRFVSTKVDE